MTAADRIDKIENFIHLQRYLAGRLFRVVVDPEDDDKFIIEFAELTKRQIHTLNYRLKDNGMLHIRCKALKVLPPEVPKNYHVKKHK